MSRRESGEVRKVSDLFERYKKTLRAPERSVVHAFCEVVSDVLGFVVEEQKVSYTPTSRVIALKTKGPLRSEIKLHEEEILLHLKGRLGEKNAPKQIL